MSVKSGSFALLNVMVKNDYTCKIASVNLVTTWQWKRLCFSYFYSANNENKYSLLNNHFKLERRDLKSSFLSII
jgi:hypothetical protein